MLKRLEGQGLITRAKNAGDERTTDVMLTQRGITLRERALEIPSAVVARLGVELTELENLHQILTRINAAAVAAAALQA
jgi:DNA-binding MarR family transcriptional regulator